MLFRSRQNAGPEAVTGVVTQLDRGKTEVAGFAKQGSAVRHPVSVPAGGQGELFHLFIFLKGVKQYDAKAEGEIRGALPAEEEVSLEV